MSDLFDTPPNLVPSGVYLARPLVVHTAAISITNPFFVSNSPVQIEQSATGDEAKKLANSCEGDPNVIVVNRPIVMDYSVELIRVSRIIKESQYDIVLCPLRGARLAGLQSRLICDDENFFPFDGTDMSRGARDEEIETVLRERILGDTKDRRSIGVLDHAKGGYSCEALTRRLKEVHEHTGEHWDVTIHLMHPADSQPIFARKAYEHQSSTFVVQVRYYPVSDLLVEDEDKLLGYGVKVSQDRVESFRLETRGQILYRDDQFASLMKPAPLDQTLFGVVSNEVGNTLSGMEDVALVEPDYWKRFMKDA